MARTADYLLFTGLYFPAGVVDLIELAGDPHGEYHKIEEDEKRDKYLESLGFTELRFENRFVFQDPEYLKNEIRKVFNKKEDRSDKPINHPGR